MRQTIASRWEKLLLYLGLPPTLVDSIKVASNRYSINQQLERFLRVWRVPDCGERMEAILYAMAESAGLVDGFPEAGAMCARVCVCVCMCVCVCVCMCWSPS